MHPVILKIGPVTIYSYGLMVAIGFGIATLMLYQRAPRFNFARDTILDFTIIILIFGIIGARILYIILNKGYYIANPIEVFNLSKGGLVWYGGLAFGLAAALFFSRINKINLWDMVDFVAPYLALAQGFGRIGCFLNGCCYGMPGQPVQLYASGALFCIFVILCYLQGRRLFKGEIFLGYGILYSLKRFFIEFLRIDNPRIFFGLTLSQAISILFFAASLALFIYKALKWKKSPLK